MDDTDLATEAFTAVVNDAINIFVPKHISRISIYPDWFSKDLKNCLRNKHHFHTCSRKTGLNFWYTEFSIYRALAKKLCSCNKQLHNDDVESLNRDPKTFWKFARQQTRDGAQGIALQNCTDQNAGYIFSSAEVANVFADYFSNCYTIGPQVAQPGDAHINCQDTFSGFKVDNEAIIEAIGELKPNLSSGADLIPSFIIKDCGDLLAPISKHV